MSVALHLLMGEGAAWVDDEFCINDLASASFWVNGVLFLNLHLSDDIQSLKRVLNVSHIVHDARVWTDTRVVDHGRKLDVVGFERISLREAQAESFAEPTAKKTVVLDHIIIADLTPVFRKDRLCDQ